MPENRLARFAVAVVLAVFTLAFIVVFVRLMLAYWVWVIDQGWNDLATLAVGALPLVLLLAIYFAWGMDDA